MAHWIFIIIAFSQISYFASSTERVEQVEKKWIDLDEVDQEVRLTTLQTQVFVPSSHFPPLYQAAKDLQELFAHANIKAIASFGATLGIMRFGECLPWDDDIDYAVDAAQEEILASLVPLADSLGYNLFPDVDDDLVGYKFYRREALIDTDSQVSHEVFIDIFLFKREGDKYVLARETGRNFFKNAWFYPREFENITFRKCGPLEMPCSEYITDFLLRFYDTEWETKALYYLSHIKEVKTYYVWTLRPTDNYPSYKSLHLEDRVKEILDS